MLDNDILKNFKEIKEEMEQINFSDVTRGRIEAIIDYVVDLYKEYEKYRDKSKDMEMENYKLKVFLLKVSKDINFHLEETNK